MQEAIRKTQRIVVVLLDEVPQKLAHEYRRTSMKLKEKRKRSLDAWIIEATVAIGSWFFPVAYTFSDVLQEAV